MQPTSSVDQIVGRNIRARRRELSKSADATASEVEALGTAMTKRVLTSIERGERPCHVAELCAIALVLHCAPARFATPDLSREHAVAFGDAGPNISGGRFAAWWRLPVIPEDPDPEFEQTAIDADAEETLTQVQRAMRLDYWQKALPLAFIENETAVLHAPFGLHTVNTEFRLTNVNEFALEHYGYTLEEMIGMSVADLFEDPEEGQLELARHVPHLTPDVARFIGATEMRRKDATTFWTETAVTRTERRDGAQYFVAYWEVASPATRAVVSRVPDNAARITLDPAGAITGWDANAEHMYGWRADEAVGQPFGLFKPEYTEQDTEQARQLVAHGHLRSTAVHIDSGGRRIAVCHDDTAERNAFGETVQVRIRAWETG